METRWPEVDLTSTPPAPIPVTLPLQPIGGQPHVQGFKTNLIRRSRNGGRGNN